MRLFGKVGTALFDTSPTRLAIFFWGFGAGCGALSLFTKCLSYAAG